MDNKETEQAKTIALTVYDGIDYSRTCVSYFPEQEQPPPAGYAHESTTADIAYRGGYRFSYFPELDHLLIGEAK